MRLASCPDETISRYGHKLEGGTRYVVPETFAAEWFRAAPDLVRISSVKSWERPYFGQDLNGKTLWVSRGCGIGDLLVLSGVLRAIKTRWPSARILLSTAPGAAELFGMNDPDSEAAKVFEFSPDVVPLDEWRAFDWHRIVEEIIELDREPDQSDIYTAHFRFFGLPDMARDPATCRPVNIVTNRARESADRFLQSQIANRKSKFLLYQLSSTSPIRTQAPASITATLSALRDAFPDLALIATGTERDRAIELSAGVIPCIGEDFRTLVGLVERAAVIVCPDSCINHIAAGLDDRSPPVVSLWSSFDPARRIATYPNQFPIYNRLPCSPCFAHEVSFPPMGCPMHRGYCRGIAEIPPARIVAAVHHALKSQISNRKSQIGDSP